MVSFGETVIPKQYKKNIRSLNLSVGGKLDREKLISFIERLEYKRVDVVEGINEYTLRGDVVDFFPSHLKNPFRVSFSYETVESICVFDPENQQPVGNLKRTTLKDTFVSQVTDNVSFMSYASPAISLSCKVRDGVVSLVGCKKTENIDLGFSVFSYSKEERSKKDLINADFLERFNFVFYVAGVDIHCDDRLGKLNISEDGIRKREKMVINHFFKKNIPLCGVLGGGYNHDFEQLVNLHSILHETCNDILNN